MAWKPSTDILKFKLTDDFEKYKPNGEELAKIFINGNETNYYVRSDGSVFSTNNVPEGYLKKLKPSKQSMGYYAVPLSVNSTVHRKFVHRLIATAFIPNPFLKPIINHKDGNKENNNVTNLEWATYKENMRHAYNTGLNKRRFGEDNFSHVISRRQAIEICKLLEQNKLCCREIAEKIGCTKNIVDNIKNHLAWNEVSQKYDVSRHNVMENSGGGYKLRPEEAEKICRELASGYYTIGDIAKKHNLPYSRIADIKKGETWTSVSLKYDFSDYAIYIENHDRYRNRCKK